MMYFEFMKNIPLAGSNVLLAVRLIFGVLSAKTFDSYFPDMMYLEFMKNIPLADSSEIFAVRLILASWPQKRLIPTF